MQKTKSHWGKSVHCKRFVLWVKHMKCVCFYNPNTILHSLVFQAYICHVAQRCGNIVTSHRNLQFYDVYNQKPTSTTNNDQLFMTVISMYIFLLKRYRKNFQTVRDREVWHFFCSAREYCKANQNGALLSPLIVSCLLRGHPGSRGTGMGSIQIPTSLYFPHHYQSCIGKIKYPDDSRYDLVLFVYILSLQ